MVNPIGLIKIVANALMLNNVNRHLRLFLHYNCGFLRTVLRNICSITRPFLDNFRAITVSLLRNTCIIRGTALIDPGYIVTP